MHVGIIMDGNRRWAKNRHLPSLLGHVEGAKNIEIILEYAYNNGAKILTLYVMSKENFVNRSEEEISHLTKLIEKFAKNIQTTLIKKGIKTIILGNTMSLPDSTKKALTDLCKSTQDGKGMLLQLCINYSGRDEIVRAVQKITASNTIVSEKQFRKRLTQYQILI
jgi:undecaprenyl diphosphate synthase